MPNFIQCLQQGHPDADSEAVKLYKAADKRARAKAELAGKEAYAADEVASELDALLVEQLSSINLQDQGVYDDLKDRNWNWNVSLEDTDAQRYCATVQTILHGALPAYCKTQRQELEEKKCAQLRSGCEAYMKHLDDVIAAESANPSVKVPRGNGYTNLDEPQPKNKKLDKAKEQHEAVRQLSSILAGDEPLHDRLQRFQSEFQRHKKLITASRDSAAEVFKKIVQSIGLVFKSKIKQVPGLWHTPEKKIAGEMSQSAHKSVKKV